MKKIMLISLVIACLWLVSCGGVHTGSTATTEATATTQVTTTDSVTTVETTITTSLTAETTISETVTTEPIAEPTEAFIEFDLNGRPILSPDDKSCFELVTKKIKMTDANALVKKKASLQTFCEELPLQCIRRYFIYDDEPDAEEMFYVPINTDEGWFIISFICYPRDTAKIEFSHTQDFIIESDEKSSTEFIETLSNDIKYDDLCELGYNGAVIFDSSKGQYSGRVGLEVLYVFKDGMAIYISFNTSVIYNIFKL